MVLKMRYAVAATVAFMLGGCGGEQAPADGGQVDAGPFDSGPPLRDAGDLDAGGFDAGAVDAGTVDAGPVDAGALDAGVDAGRSVDGGGCPATTGIVLDPADAGLPAQGLRLWLRPDLAVATVGDAGVSICRWEDLTGHGLHFVPSTATPPTLSASGLRGRPSVTISSAGRSLVRGDVLGLAPTSGRTVAVLSLNRDLTRRYEAFFQGLTGSPGTYLGLDTNTFNTAGAREGVYITGNAFDADLATAAIARTHVLSISTMAPGTAVPAALTYTVDGVVRALSSTPDPGSGVIQSFLGANFTALGRAAGGFTGAELGDVLVWDRALTPAERAQVEAYFSARYP
jgi:hypothetical protein